MGSFSRGGCLTPSWCLALQGRGSVLCCAWSGQTTVSSPPVQQVQGYTDAAMGSSVSVGSHTREKGGWLQQSIARVRSASNTRGQRWSFDRRASLAPHHKVYTYSMYYCTLFLQQGTTPITGARRMPPHCGSREAGAFFSGHGPPVRLTAMASAERWTTRGETPTSRSARRPPYVHSAAAVRASGCAAGLWSAPRRWRCPQPHADDAATVR